MDTKVTLLVPTYNEIGGFKQVMPRVNAEWCDQILIVDGGSKDGTAEYAQEKGYSVLRQARKGLRHAYIEALSHAVGDIIITFSPDGNSIPELIPPLIKKMKEGYDMVIVSRYAKGAKSEDDDMITAFGNWMFTNLINMLYGSRYTDAFVMFRAWRKEAFYSLDLDKEETYSLEERLFNTKVGVEPLLSVRAAKKGLRCDEIPGDEPARIDGKRKLQIVRWGSAYLFEVIREKFFWNR